jgi:hypothetical protein
MSEPDTNPTSLPSLEGEVQRQDIYAARKIIADISSGVYRSPAAAIKELITNSYDADATRVTISTDQPHLRSFTITDDGSGMTIEDFLDIMAHIGGSRKRQSGEISPIYSRPLIGRIGIGLLAVAQLGTRFYLSSKKRGEKTRFLAEVNLESFHKDETALQTMNTGRDGEVTIGAIRYVRDIPDDSDSHFTVISVPDAKRGLSSEITGLARKTVGATDVLSIKDGIRPFEIVAAAASGAKRADLELDNYFFMLWELGILCPLDYLPGGAFRPQTRPIENIASLRLPESTGFNVFVDGIALYRPQIFPTARSLGYPSPDPKVYPLDYSVMIGDRPLRLTGYVYSQQPGITPEEIKGVHIRIRNVGIGLYDRTWLGYPFDEGLKFGQVTGEVFIVEGLESALNIDRDSFRETDVHFQALKAYVWGVLRETVFPDFKVRQRLFRKKRQELADAISRVQAVAAAVANNRMFEGALLDLPAPDETGFADHRSGPLLLSKIRSSENDSAKTLDSASIRNWTELTQELSPEGVERFEKVLRVLISSELLEGVVEDDLAGVLRALSIAVK